MTAGEAAARRLAGSRSTAWMLAYPLLAMAAMLPPKARRRRRSGEWSGVLIGVPLAFAGYPAGLALWGFRASSPPPDPIGRELTALAAIVAPAEELVWGRRVEPVLGVPATAMLFAAKHVVVDGRWRRGLGLALFWTGLGLVRRRSPALSLIVHVAANAAGVIVGHAEGRDRF